MLWDVDYTLVGADGLGTRLYEVVFREMFGRELTKVAPKAGRTDRAIIGDTLALAGVPAAAAGPSPPGLDVLTERERAVALAVTDGATNAEIARQLYVSAATVKATISRILAKLELDNRVQLAVVVRNSRPRS